VHAATEISIESNCPRGQFPVRSGAEIRFEDRIFDVVTFVIRPPSGEEVVLKFQPKSGRKIH